MFVWEYEYKYLCMSRNLSILIWASVNVSLCETMSRSLTVQMSVNMSFEYESKYNFVNLSSNVNKYMNISVCMSLLMSASGVSI